jgi:uncharacterized protein (DUF488 family)
MVATIGYEKASLADFIGTLKLSKIEVLVDVRDRAQSRRPGFSKSSLSEALRDAGIGYVHMRELGDPVEGREAARRGDYAAFHAIFTEVMASTRAKEAIKKLEKLALERDICLMCYERDQTVCHRKIVAERLEQSLGRKARHLGVKEGAGKPTTARRVHDPNQGTAASL